MKKRYELLTKAILIFIVALSVSFIFKSEPVKADFCGCNYFLKTGVLKQECYAGDTESCASWERDLIADPTVSLDYSAGKHPPKCDPITNCGGLPLVDRQKNTAVSPDPYMSGTVDSGLPSNIDTNNPADRIEGAYLIYGGSVPGAKKNDLDNLMNDLNARKPILEINIPGLNFSNVASSTDDSGTYFYIAWIPEFISALYKFGIAIVSIVAVVIIIIQGMRVVTSGGGEKKASAYKKIGQAIIGLMIAWGSFAILYNINPALVQFNALKVQVVQGIPFDDSNTLSDLSPEEAALVASGSGCGGVDTATGGVPLIKQTDQNWQTDKTGCRTDNIAKSGCGPTSLSMVMAKYYGINNQPNPLELEKKFRDAGARKCGTGTSGGWSNKSVLGDFKYEDVWNNGKSRETNINRILQILSAKKPVIVGVKAPSIFTAGGHYIVLTGINANGTLTVNDPMKCTYACKALVKDSNGKSACPAGQEINPPLTPNSIPQEYVWPHVNQAHYIYPSNDKVPLDYIYVPSASDLSPF